MSHHISKNTPTNYIRKNMRITKAKHEALERMKEVRGRVKKAGSYFDKK